MKNNSRSFFLPWFFCRTRINDMSNEIATFTSRKDAQNAVNRLNTRTYYLAYGEYERPAYKVRKMRKEDRYYIRVEYFFYVGTFGAMADGPLSEDLIP